MLNEISFSLEPQGDARWRLLLDGTGYIGVITGGRGRYAAEHRGESLGAFKTRNSAVMTVIENEKTASKVTGSVTA